MGSASKFIHSPSIAKGTTAGNQASKSSTGELLPKATIETGMNVYLADGTYYADGSVSACGETVIESAIQKTGLPVNAPAKAVKE